MDSEKVEYRRKILSTIREDSSNSSLSSRRQSSYENLDLINFETTKNNTVRMSVLQSFDPFFCRNDNVTNKVQTAPETAADLMPVDLRPLSHEISECEQYRFPNVYRPYSDPEFAAVKNIRSDVIDRLSKPTMRLVETPQWTPPIETRQSITPSITECDCFANILEGCEFIAGLLKEEISALESKYSDRQCQSNENPLPLTKQQRSCDCYKEIPELNRILNRIIGRKRTLEPSSPALPPRSTQPLSSSRPASNQYFFDASKIATKLHESVIFNNTYIPELMEFYNMVKRVRSKFNFDCGLTNVGCITAMECNYRYPEGTTVNIWVFPMLTIDTIYENLDFMDPKNPFKCYQKIEIDNFDVCITVEHLIMHALELQQISSDTADNFILKPIGVNEWIRPTSTLRQLNCVHQSLKLGHALQLAMWPKVFVNLNELARIQIDDERNADIKPADILPHEPVKCIDYDSVRISLEHLEEAIEHLEHEGLITQLHITPIHTNLVPCVRMICSLLGKIETLSITDAVKALCEVVSGRPNYDPSVFEENGFTVLVDSDEGNFARVNLRPRSFAEQITQCGNSLREAIENLIKIYFSAFRVDFCIQKIIFKTNIPSLHVLYPLKVHVMCLHRVQLQWNYKHYMIGVMIYHGTRFIGSATAIQCSFKRSGLFSNNIKFDDSLCFDDIPVCALPRESRLILVLYGCNTEYAKQSDPNSKTELGWSSIQFFDFKRNMINGSYLLTQWPPTSDKFIGPAPSIGTHPYGDSCPALSIRIASYGGQVVFPEPKTKSIVQLLDFNSLDKTSQQELIDTAEQGFPCEPEKYQVLWEKRQYLHKFPHALPKILLAAHSWDYDSANDLHALIRSWEPLSPLQALELFLPTHPDIVVRAQAVQWISSISNDELTVYLPQLLQALKHDTYEASALSEFLLTRSLESPRVAHHLYRLLVHSLPGDSLQNTIEQSQPEFEETIITMARHKRRNQMMLRALLASCGERLSGKFLAQDMMCKTLADVASKVKEANECNRQSILIEGIEYINTNLEVERISLPLNPSFEVTAINSRCCGYFNSNTLPMKVSYIGPDRMTLPVIFKVGDDLQQDMLTIQLVRLMDRLWLEEGLDLKMVTFECVPTGHKRGMMEMVSEAETLRKIHAEYGVTGCFKEKIIAEWLQKMNTSSIDYQRAVYNFTASCAGYIVVTYILGICDRHNDNIMLKKSGHLFHIDFGKFLGDAQMFGNFRRDRVPFVLTPDMAYVINMGDKPSIKFQHFVDLCCKAFNIVREHSDLVLLMLALMLSSGIPGVNADAVNYVRGRLLPDMSNPEAAAYFNTLIHTSLKTMFTQVNFCLHNLGQLGSTADSYSDIMAEDGRLERVCVTGFKKVNDSPQLIYFQLLVTRESHLYPTTLKRAYNEFVELEENVIKKSSAYGHHRFLSSVNHRNPKISVDEINQFLVALFNLSDEIVQSNLVYTFFRRMSRDLYGQDVIGDLAQSSSRCGEIEVSVQYRNRTLHLLIHHARFLLNNKCQEPNARVTVQFISGRTKSLQNEMSLVKPVKLKTEGIRKNCHPTFMQTYKYDMPLEEIRDRALKITLFSDDKEIGRTIIILEKTLFRKGFMEWFSL